MSLDPNAPPTIGDVIAAQTTASAAQAAAAASAASADKTLADANDLLASANTSVAADLALVGPVFTLDMTTNPPLVKVFFPDSTATGFHIIVPSPVSTPVPATSAPLPAA
jgi:hypothetical protein